MGNLLFGLEAELAVSARKGKAAVPVAEVASALLGLARRRLPHLSGGGSRIFLENGGLFYVDCGCHPEVATPECTDPWQAVAQLRAGEQIVAKLGLLVREESGYDEVLVNRCNVDYVGGTTWGNHESYCTRLPIRHYEPWLIPHLVSRVYTGSGGLDPLSAGIRFSLSPRVAHIGSVVSSQSTAERGIFHTRDERLSRTYNRLHILVGDNACSQTAQLIKIGSTALVVALAECKGQEPPARFKDPLKALKGFARDPEQRVDVRLPAGNRKMSAREIQLLYVEQIESLANAPQFPEWTARFCGLWRSTLENLGRDGADGRTVFDWALKRELMNREIERSGLSREAVDAWSDCLEEIQRSLPAADMRCGSADLARFVRMRPARSESSAVIIKADKVLAERDLAWKALDDFIALRQRLLEIDVRFGLVQDGIFDSFDREGLLPGHRVISEAEVDAAAKKAPVDTRAHLRGYWVGQLAGNEHYLASWDAIHGEQKHLDLGDPFSIQAEWKACAASEAPPPPHRAVDETELLGIPAWMIRSPDGRRNQAYEFYREGRYDAAEAVLTELLRENFEPANIRCHLARLCLVRGHSAGAAEHVAAAWAAREGAEPYVVARTIWLQLALTFLGRGCADAAGADGRAPSRSLLIGRLKTLLQDSGCVQHWNMAPVLDCFARLPAEQRRLLTSLVAAMSDRRRYPALYLLQSWRTQSPQPLESDGV